MNQGIVEATQSIINKYCNVNEIEPNFLDLRDLKTYAIDSEDTKEVDDAISIQQLKDGNKFWIHISSPTEFIEYNSLIDNFARSKSNTVYLNSLTEYMFPLELIENILSFDQDKDSLALSICVSLSSDGSISNYEILRTYINVDYRLSYKDADELLDYEPKEESDLLLIDKLMSKRRQYRQNNGSLNIDEPLGKFYLNDNNIVEHTIVFSRSRLLISEAMILFGTILANYSFRHKIVMPYRVQPFPDTNPKEQVSQSIHLLNFQRRQCLRKSYISTEPGIHYSLGLNRYIQASSPIRRYIDLISHFQILHHLNNNSQLIPLKDMINIIDHYNKISKQSIIRMQFEKTILIIDWFEKSEIKLWDLVFLKWLNKSKRLALVYFPILEIDHAVIFKKIKEVYFGFSLSATYLFADRTNNLLIFSIS